MLSIQKILHPTDFSERSQSAFQLACSLARDHGARLIVLHVAAPTTMLYGDVVAEIADDSRKCELFNHLAKIHTPDPDVPCSHEFKEGDAADEILKTAAEQHCDLIVMGTHGRSGIGHLLMGSVAEKVVRKALCPVVTVKSPLPDTRPE